MLQNYAHFYTDLYRASGGFVPLWPFMTKVALGDLYVIRAGQMLKTGNVFDNFFGIYKDVEIEEEWAPVWESWKLQSGMRQSFVAKDALMELDGIIFPAEKQGLLVQFEQAGDYHFVADGVVQRSINNFYEIRFKLLQELAAGKFNFKEVFVITSVAKAAELMLMIAGGNAASMMLSQPEEIHLPQTGNHLFANKSKWTVESMQNMETIHIDTKGSQLFFKAQKLEVSNQGRERVRSYLRQNLPESMRENVETILRFVPTEILPAADISPATIHELFHFREMNLDDLAMFFS